MSAILGNTLSLEDTLAMDNKKIKIGNWRRVKEKLEILINDGPEKLQILSDFDWTMTKWKENGKLLPSSHGVMEESDIMPKSFIKKVKDIFAHYYPIEINPNISDEDKIPIMEEWWTKTRAALLETNITRAMITEMTGNTPLRLRDGLHELAMDLCDWKIPLLIFSAGIGDIVIEILKHEKLFLRNQTVISNQIEWDDKGAICGYKNPIIHSFNKNVALKRHLGYFEHNKNRCNAILMGDSIGDLRMTQGVDSITTCLKVGFLNDKIDERLPSYMQNYDIVLVEDGTMSIPRKIFDAILKK